RANRPGEVIRVSGVVKPGTLARDESLIHLTFDLADSQAPDAPSIRVSAPQPPARALRDGLGVLVEGTYAPPGGLTAERLIVEHGDASTPDGESERPSL